MTEIIKNNANNKNGRRAVIVGGLRTPFLKSFTEFTELDTIALGTTLVRDLISKMEIPVKIKIRLCFSVNLNSATFFLTFEKISLTFSLTLKITT